ncbi:MAG: hypothetical protein KDI68_02480 [Gammaproteobacteria bacterium]|nr:hypothetical protein [Gammaproteobacteria bacterium]
MSREIDRISTEIGCIDTANLPATLISTLGAHCKVYKAGGLRAKGASHDVVLKMHTLSCDAREAELYQRDYRKLRQQLGDIIPQALFVRTRIAGVENLLVLAQAHTPWFNIANPANEAEAMPMMKGFHLARDQLRNFVAAARGWQREESKVIDLFGLDNLVLDRKHQIRYLDSFEVFFYEDMLHLIEHHDRELEERITISLQRLEYLEYLVAQ